MDSDTINDEGGTQEATTVDLTEPDETYITATRVNATAADYEVDIEKT